MQQRPEAAGLVRRALSGVIVNPSKTGPARLKHVLAKLRHVARAFGASLYLCFAFSVSGLWLN